MTDTDRQRLAAILGMLGSEHQGERDNAALQAEAFRQKHGLTWAELVSGAPPSWVQQAEDVMRAATKRIAELEDEIQSLAQRPPAAAPPPPPPKPDPFVWSPWTAPELTPSAPSESPIRVALVGLLWGSFPYIALFLFLLVGFWIHP